VTFALLDECVAKCCQRGGSVYTAQRSREVAVLGPGASDQDIYEFVRRTQCILVTCNGKDFAALVMNHVQIRAIVLPQVEPKKQRKALMLAFPMARAAFDSHGPRFVEVTADGHVLSYRISGGFAWPSRLPAHLGRPSSTIH
jgi:predicted nuclease of predicted toxin-antitoxin system